MQTTERPMVKDRPEVIAIHNRTLNTLTRELGSECQKVVTLLSQLQLPDLSASQQATILAELLASTIHLQTHCGEDFQDLISDALEALPDTDELD
jgi:hypothetical protein